MEKKRSFGHWVEIAEPELNSSSYLRAEGGLVVEDSLYKITELLGSNLALAADADAAGLADDLADHVLGLGGRRVRVLLPLPADGPLGDVVRPHVRRHAGRGLAETATKDSVSATHLQEGDW